VSMKPNESKTSTKSWVIEKCRIH